MASGTALYMCSSCRHLFASLEDIVAHHLTCHPSSTGPNTISALPQPPRLPQSQPEPFISSSTQPSPKQSQSSNHWDTTTTVTSPSTTLQLSCKNPSQRATPLPLIRYQCGECGTLFMSLDLWQQHSKLGCVAGEEEKKASKDGVKMEAAEMHNAEDPEDKAEERGSNYKPKHRERVLENKAEKDKGLSVKVNAQNKNHGQGGLTETGASNQQNRDLIRSQPDEDASVPNPVSGDSGPSLGATSLCMQCGSGFNSEEALAAHRSSHHGLERTLHRCSTCSQEFMNTTQYLYHRRQHKEKGEGVPVTLVQNTNHALGFFSKITDDRNRSLASVEIPNEPAVSVPNSPQAVPPTPPPLTQNHPGAPCPICGQVCQPRCRMHAHMLRHSGQKPYSCDMCHKTFTCKSNLGHQGHMDSSHQPRVCQECQQSLTQSARLKKHQLLHVCEKTETKGGGEVETEGSRGEKEEVNKGATRTLFVCSDCPNRYRTRAQLLLHRFVHTGQYPFSCSVCGESFPSKKSLHLHALTHKGEQPVICPSCSEKFSDQTTLDAHLLLCEQKVVPGHETNLSFKGVTKKTGGGARRTGKLICDLCGHRCVTKEGLDLHRLSHTGQTPLRCPLLPCKRRFTSSSALQEHMLSHGSLNPEHSATGGDPKPRHHHCPHCGKSFTTASSLNVHVRIHTGERPFQCGQCGKCFRQIPHLRDHERLHAGTRPFVCSVCDRSFLLAARLAEHARTHSGDKPYQCQLCHRAFRSLSNLGKHRKTHGLAFTGEPTTTMVELAGAEAQVQVGEVSAGQCQASVHTILLVETPESTPQDLVPNSSQNATVSPTPLVLVHPVAGEGQQGVLAPVLHHTIEVVLTEND